MRHPYPDDVAELPLESDDAPGQGRLCAAEVTPLVKPLQPRAHQVCQCDQYTSTRTLVVDSNVGDSLLLYDIAFSQLDPIVIVVSFACRNQK